MSIHSFPRCAGYLKGMRVNLNDPEMTDYWFAVIVGDAAFNDDELVKAGTVNFETMRGEDLLRSFEALFPNRQKTRNYGLSHEDRDSLKAYLGSRGVKVSALKSDDDYWHVASLMWPRVKRNVNDDLSNLLAQIRAMPKKIRSSSARPNKIPSQWRGV